MSKKFKKFSKCPLCGVHKPNYGKTQYCICFLPKKSEVFTINGRKIIKDCIDSDTTHTQNKSKYNSLIRPFRQTMGFNRVRKKSAAKKKENNKKIVRPKFKKSRVSKKTRDAFLVSREWRMIRYEILIRDKRICLCCGSKKTPLHVDHIKPLSLYWDLRLDSNNLQVLCADCNIGKSNIYEHSFRPVEMALL